ncbi:(d)CMP kinase [Antarcticibacterium sp. 1MA-6-2]|nr:(d)CMP kinase [Antarcticibacterium sp. 1MA-6-2]UJH91494.1 (d)CMP kinase [Antarcticibacterium sp. 1MA-6-2]
MNKNITIAIDGFSSTGKSTVARQLAKELGYVYVDSLVLCTEPSPYLQ